MTTNLKSEWGIKTGKDGLDSIDLSQIEAEATINTLDTLQAEKERHPGYISPALTNEGFTFVSENSHLLNGESPISITLGAPDKQVFLPGTPVKDIYKELARLRKAHQAAKNKIEQLNADKSILNEFIDWIELDWKLEKNDCSRLHRLVESIKKQEVRMLDSFRLAEGSNPYEWDKVQTFVVQHDWAAAFSKAEDYADGTFKLPYESCAFEFRIGGKNLIVTALQYADEAKISYVPFIEMSTGWLCPIESKGGALQEFSMNVDIERTESFRMLYEQIKAICIALEAQAAVSVVERASEKLNKKRLANDKTPLYSYHVVSLSHRTRVATPLSEPGHSGRRHRLHFRRGHWRHYTDHKTWIKWMLVGDFDLGFVDKEYRL